MSSLFRKHLLFAQAKVASFARGQPVYIRKFSVQGRLGRNLKVKERTKTRESDAGSKTVKLLNYGLKFGPALVKYVPIIITNGPKFLFGMLVCGSMGYLYYLKKLYGSKLTDLKTTLSDKYNGAVSKVSASVEALKTATNNVTDKAGRSLGSARDTVADLSDKVISTVVALDPASAVTERVAAAKDKIIDVKDQVADKVTEMKDRWTPAPSSRDESSEPAASITEKLNSLKQKIVEKAPTFGREASSETKVDQDATVTEQKAGSETMSSPDSPVNKMKDKLLSKLAETKNKLSSSTPKEGGEEK